MNAEWPLSAARLFVRYAEGRVDHGEGFYFCPGQF